MPHQWSGRRHSLGAEIRGSSSVGTGDQMLVTQPTCPPGCDLAVQALRKQVDNLRRSTAEVSSFRVRRPLRRRNRQGPVPRNVSSRYCDRLQVAAGTDNAGTDAVSPVFDDAARHRQKSNHQDGFPPHSCLFRPSAGRSRTDLVRRLLDAPTNAPNASGCMRTFNDLIVLRKVARS